MCVEETDRGRDGWIYRERETDQQIEREKECVCERGRQTDRWMERETEEER